MRALFPQILILSLLCRTAFVPVAVVFGQEWGSPVFSPARVQPLPDVAYQLEASERNGTSGAATYPWEPRHDLPKTSHTDALVSAASYEDGTAESSGSPGLGGWTFGYDDGFLIASPSGLKPDTDDSDFLMKINSWGQLRHSASDFHGPNYDLNEFEFERLRLSFKGHAISPDFQYFFQFDSDSDEGEDSAILDYYVTYDIGHHAWGCPRKRLEIRAGKWKVPFARFRVIVPTQLEFTDFSMASAFFDVNRGVGVGLLGERDLCGRLFNWEVALANGINVGGFRTDRSYQLDNNLGFFSRVMWLLTGDEGEDGEPDLDFRVCPAWRVGAGIAGSHVNRGGLREFLRMRVVDSGRLISDVLPATVTDYDIFLFTVDSHVRYRGFSLITDYYLRSLSQFFGAAVPDVWDHGFLIQMGYFVVPGKFELLTRWSRVVGDSGTAGRLDQSADEVSGGAGWYIRGENLKLTFDVTHVNGAPVSSSMLNVLPGDNGWLFRTQFQWRF